jgi:hypothetical protein
MRRATRILVATALLAVLAMSALAPAASPSPAGYRYPAAIKKQFVKGCVKGGGSKRACTCAINSLERHYSYKSFLRLIDRVNRTGKFPRKAEKLIQACA